MNFIDAFVHYTQELESPTSYFQWAAISTLSAVMRDNVFLHQGKLLVYPNIYVMILADSAATRKGLPLKIAKSLIKKVDNTKLILGRSSIQGIIQELAKVEQNHSGLISKKGASGLLYSEEFASSLVKDEASINILTDIYDYHEKWESMLVSGKTTLEKVCFGMFVATNEDMLKQVYNNTALYGGLLGRTFIIAESKRRKKNSMVFHEPEEKDADKFLVDHLKNLSKIKGRVAMTKEAAVAYDTWYNDIDDEDIAKDKTGHLGRAGTLVAKLSLVMAAAETYQIQRGSLEITLENFQAARELAFKVKANQQKLTFGQGMNPNAQQMAIVISALAKAPNFCLTRREFLATYWTALEIDVFDKTIITFETSGILKTTNICDEIAYQLTPKAVREILNDGNSDSVHDKEGKARVN